MDCRLRRYAVATLLNATQQNSQSSDQSDRISQVGDLPDIDVSIAVSRDASLVGRTLNLRHKASIVVWPLESVAQLALARLLKVYDHQTE